MDGPVGRADMLGMLPCIGRTTLADYGRWFDGLGKIGMPAWRLKVSIMSSNARCFWFLMVSLEHLIGRLKRYRAACGIRTVTEWTGWWEGTVPGSAHTVGLDMAVKMGLL